MMTLFDVARSQDTELFRDAYGTATFMGQMLPFAESVRSGPSSKRRVLEVSPTVSIPAKKTVVDVSTGQVFVMSSPSFDWWQGAPIAAKYPVLPVDHQFSIRTVEQVLVGSGGVTDAYMEPSYIRRVILEEQSDYLGGYEILFSSYYSISSGQIVYGDGRWYRVRENSRLDDIGFGVAEGVELYTPLATQVVSRRVLNPITDVEVTTQVTVQTFSEPLVLNYRHEVLGYIKPEAGDLAISVLKSAVPVLQRGDLVGTHGLVMAVESLGNTWVAHVRRNHG